MVEDIRGFLLTVGVPESESLPMAQLLDKRAQQLASERSQSYEEALGHLIALMKQGWAAKQRGMS